MKNSSWELSIKSGAIKESDISCWDDIPQDSEIKQAVFQLLDGKKLVFKNFNKICLAKIGSVSMNGETSHIGYCITEVKNDRFLSLIIKKDYIEQVSGTIDTLTVPEHCFRKGTGV